MEFLYIQTLNYQDNKLRLHLMNGYIDFEVSELYVTLEDVSETWWNMP
jgi:hypothetical protein